MVTAAGPRRVGTTRRRGQVLAETAIALPVLLLVAIGLVQFALYDHARNVVTIAVQDGARLAAAEDRTLDEGVAHAQILLRAGLGPSAERVAVEGRDEQGTVTVRAQGQLRTVIPWVADASLPLAARATVSREQFRAEPRG
jgi:Flp pilus assembly protein TadG